MRKFITYASVGFIGYVIGFYEYKYKSQKELLENLIEKSRKALLENLKESE